MKVALLTGETSALGAAALDRLLSRPDTETSVLFLRYGGRRDLSSAGLARQWRHSGPAFLLGKALDLAQLRINRLAGAMGVAVNPRFACEIAARRGVNQIIVDDANGAAALAALGAFAPDVLATAGFGQILKPAALQIPRLAAVNVHPSLLPRYPGANPLRDILAAGERQSGATVHRLTAVVDGGEILTQRAFDIPAGAGQRRLAGLAGTAGAAALLDALAMLEQSS